MTVQLFEMHLPVILVLNMMDTAAAAKIKIDVLALAHIFNVPVIPMVASKIKGVEELKSRLSGPICGLMKILSFRMLRTLKALSANCCLM